MLQEETKSLLRPNQVEDFREEISRIEEIEQQPAFVRNQISDFGKMQQYKRHLAEKLETEAPKPLSGPDLDTAVERERELRDQIADGMPTQGEMRRNPPGAVDKHRKWETRNKQKIREWKNLRLRLGASGALSDTLPDSTDVASVERFRPVGGGGEMNLDVAQITPRDYHMPAKPESVVLSADEIAAIREVRPDVAEKLAFMSPDGRRAMKEAVANHTGERIINSGSLDAAGWPGVLKLARHFDITANGRKKEDLYAEILESHSGEAWPEDL